MEAGPPYGRSTLRLERVICLRRVVSLLNTVKRWIFNRRRPLRLRASKIDHSKQFLFMPFSIFYRSMMITFAGLFAPMAIAQELELELKVEDWEEVSLESEPHSASVTALDVGTPDAWQLDRGYLFLGTEYVPRGSKVLIDKPQQLPTAEQRLIYSESPIRTDVPTISARVFHTLKAGGVAIAMQDHLQYTWGLENGGLEILRSLVTRTSAPNIQLPPEFQEPALRKWLKSTSLSPETRKLAEADIEEFTRTVDTNISSSQALTRLSYFGYPLTIAAMIMVVVSFGHLLSFRPQEMSRDAQHSAAITQATSKSIILVGIMGLLDLVMTVMSFQANAMQELNPVAGELLNNIPALVTFKIGLTAFALVVLFYARAIRIAQVAAWWGCLIMTLLTARWVIFSHMAIS